MFDTLKSLLGFGTKQDFAVLVNNGAVILDVRSAMEFASGHIKNAINIPVENLSSNLSKLPSKNKTIITCCAGENLKFNHQQGEIKTLKLLVSACEIIQRWS